MIGATRLACSRYTPIVSNKCRPPSDSTFRHEAAIDRPPQTDNDGRTGRPELRLRPHHSRDAPVLRLRGLEAVVGAMRPSDESVVSPRLAASKIWSLKACLSEPLECRRPAFRQSRHLGSRSSGQPFLWLSYSLRWSKTCKVLDRRNEAGQRSTAATF